MTTFDDKIKLALFLFQVPKLGNYRIKQLMSVYTSLEHILSVSFHNLSQIEGIGEPTAKEILKFSYRFEAVNKILEQCEKSGISLLGFWMENYPSALKVLDGMPVLLYFKGNLESLNLPSVAIVGTRHPSAYGKRTADFFSTELAQSGLQIVSGFARGIDTIAHLSAIKSDGSTIAVLGSGFNHIYPAENKSMIPKIYEKGGILTEYSPDTKPDSGHFPERNRIISALSAGTLIIESGESGGALITASYALEQNKEIFSVPGEIFSEKSKGTNKLILNGTAKPVLSVNDILDELPQFRTTPKKEKPKPELTIFEEPIYNSLSEKPIHIDELAELLGTPTSELLIHLLGLEFKSVVRQLPGKYFVRL